MRKTKVGLITLGGLAATGGTHTFGPCRCYSTSWLSIIIHVHFLFILVQDFYFLTPYARRVSLFLRNRQQTSLYYQPPPSCRWMSLFLAYQKGYNFRQSSQGWSDHLVEIEIYVLAPLSKRRQRPWSGQY
ncbi:hypothetical protein BGW36DRAFT_379297 [Talaromyces proteolyticus]|uniref:Uncharacterized protein n=1 Tax=Talaromyces proteolyticus TaxID=1131652 RepID=A0AAD4KVM8_9EURO|nr:uncharacterized protein BGW36DRAFT_379297 [Talaromyces proteolyticus]KAH8697716.1 hypothetical protein BGW36DRAFT_379297 [Talaromyces proteolyticus]